VSEQQRIAEWYVGDDWVIELPDEHCLRLGRLVARLQALETLVRFALQDRAEAELNQPSVGAAAFMARAGDSVGVPATDHFVSFDNLGQLVAKFNRAFPDHSLDLASLDLRDAIAHGRIMRVIVDGSAVFRLVKFSQVRSDSLYPGYSPVPHYADVEFAELMTHDWFAAWVSFLDAQIERVRAAALRRSAPVVVPAPAPTRARL
jgi:hypothetical protein